MVDDKVDLAEVKRQEETEAPGDSPRSLDDSQNSEPKETLDTSETTETGSSQS